MALLTDDMDLNETYLQTMMGGNGDYYIRIIYRNEEDGLLYVNGVRIAMSGGLATTRVKLAACELFRAMEEAELNNFPN